MSSIDVKAFVQNARIDDPVRDDRVDVIDWLECHADHAGTIDVTEAQHDTL